MTSPHLPPATPSAAQHPSVIASAAQPPFVIASGAQRSAAIPNPTLHLTNPAASRMTVLDVTAISKRFGGVRAVDSVSFQVAAGEMLALIGPNGAGKSTCFNMLNGQIPPDSGRISLKDRDITGLSPRRIWRLGVGRTFQITATFASMTVRENVQVALLAHHRRIWRFIRPAAAWFAAEADALLAQVGHARPGRPRRRRPGLRRPQAPGTRHRPRQRPVTAADGRTHRRHGPRRTRRPHAAHPQLAAESGIAVLFTEHDMDVVFGIADRILVLNRGELIAEGDGAAIRANPRVREVYLGSGATSGGH